MEAQTRRRISWPSSSPGNIEFALYELQGAAGILPAEESEKALPTRRRQHLGGPVSEGIWKPIAAVLGGARVRDTDLKAITLKITGGNYEVTVEGEKDPDKGTCTLDTNTSPKRMTIKSTDGPNRGRRVLDEFVGPREEVFQNRIQRPDEPAPAA